MSIPEIFANMDNADKVLMFIKNCFNCFFVNWSLYQSHYLCRISPRGNAENIACFSASSLNHCVIHQKKLCSTY